MKGTATPLFANPPHPAVPNPREPDLDDLDPTDESCDLMGVLLERYGGDMPRAEAKFYELLGET